ncbi:iron ABC transporter permease [Alicyclobacillus sp. SO9]|uniref:ABC transporter permease n=1 Tax=Alicyclobacillus sp. SO9 TaxID=2665646 RepID=UPI0018E7CE51|nr:iron ABC transporter permease [Alicyclobacillus sp. SO9]QQE78997.1 iron ABC transporter permease [Alicyclobacillus sp. SO9]
MTTSRTKSKSLRIKGWGTSLPSLLILAVLILYPLASLLLQIIFPHIFDQKMSLAPSLKPIIGVFSDKLNMEALFNSLWIGLAAAVVAAILGTLTAFGTSQAPRKLKIVLDLLIWMTLFAPSYIIAQGWMIFMQDGGIAAQIFGLPNGWSNWFFSKPGLVVVMGLRYLPFVHLAMMQAVENLGIEFERAGRSLGARRWTIFRRITMPLLTPGLLAGVSIAFAEGFGDFGFAAAITPQTHIPLLTFQIYASLYEAPVNYAAAAVLSLVLLVIMALAIWLQMWWMRRGTYVTVSNQSRAAAQSSARQSMNWRTTAALIVAAIGLLIPAGSTAVASMWKTFSNGIAASNWTFHHYAKALQLGGEGVSSVLRSLGYSLSAAVITMVIALYIAYLLQFKKSPAMKFVNAITMATIAIPGIVLAAGFIFAWNANWLIPIHLVLYGTSICLGMAYIAGTLPYAIRLDIGAISQLSPNLMVAAQSLGAKQIRVMQKIVFPLISSTMVSTFFLTQTGIMFELPASSLLYPAGQPPLPIEIASKFKSFEWAQGSALTVIGMIFVLGLYGLGRYIIYRVQKRTIGKQHDSTVHVSQVEGAGSSIGLEAMGSGD